MQSMFKEVDEIKIMENKNSSRRTPEDPLKCYENIEKHKLGRNDNYYNDEDSCTAISNKPATNLLDDVVESILQNLKKPVEIMVGVTEILATETKGKQLPGETKEEQEKRLLKKRLLKFKSRLLLKIEQPEKAQIRKAQVTMQSRLRREKRLARETPDETETRKQKTHIASITLRKRIQELETPEQKAERMAKDREKSRLRLHKKRATETPEERLNRKQRQKDYQRNRRTQTLAMRTGKFHKQHRQKQNSEMGKDE